MAGCSCGGDCELKLLYACSGMANTGMLADQVWRKLVRDKVGSGTCLSAIGAGLSGFLESARNADRNIVLDGCPVACGAKIFAKEGLAFEHYVMTDFGVEKGKTAITPDIVAEVAAAVAAKIEGAGK
jgi:Uncharacterized conserved protein